MVHFIALMVSFWRLGNNLFLLVFLRLTLDKCQTDVAELQSRVEKVQSSLCYENKM